MYFIHINKHWNNKKIVSLMKSKKYIKIPYALGKGKLTCSGVEKRE